MFKRVLSVILALAMIMTLCCNITLAESLTPSAGGGASGSNAGSGSTGRVTIACGTVSGDAGETVIIPVSISGNTGTGESDGIAGYTINLTYDPDYLTPVESDGFVDGEVALANPIYKVNIPADASPYVSISTAQFANKIGDGTLFSCKFLINQNIKTKEQTTVEIDVVNIKYVDEGVIKNRTYNVDSDATVNINPDANIPVTFTIDTTAKTYNGETQAPTITATVAGGAAYTGSYDVTYNGEADLPKDAATYTVAVAVSADDASKGYSGTKTESFTINQAPIYVSVDEGQQKRVGNDDPTFTYTHDQSRGDFFGLDEGITGALTRVAGENAGKYKIKQGTLSVPSNYKLYFTEGEFEIIEKNIQQVVLADLPASTTYGDANFSFAVTQTDANVTNAPVYTSSNASVATINESTGEVTIVGAGSTELTVSVTSDNNDYADFSAKKTLVVAKRNITITADEKTVKVGAEEKPLTYTITSGSLVGADTCTGALARDVGNAIGDYNIKQGTLSCGPNYNMTFVGSVYHIVSKTPQTITVADVAQKTYGDGDITLAITPDPTANLSTYTCTSSDESVATVTNEGVVTIVGAGEVVITVSQSGNEEYAPTSAIVPIKINPALLTLAAELQNSENATVNSFVYGNSAYATAKIVATGFVNGDDIDDLTTRATLSGVPVENQIPGSYSVEISGATSNNYTITHTPFAYTITKRPIKLSAFGVFDRTYVEGNTSAEINPHAFVFVSSNTTGSESGFVYGDDAALNITSAVNFDSDAEGTRTATLDSSAIGEITGADAANYQFVAPEAGSPLTANATIHAAATKMAATIASQISGSIVVAQNATTFTLPTVPAGYTIAIKTSDNTDVLALDATVSPADTDVVVNVTFTITSTTDETDTATTGSVAVTVPRPEKKTVTTVVYGNGTLTGNAGQQMYGSTITLTATPNSGYKVSEWFVNNVSIGDVGSTYTFTLTDDIEIAVKFVLKGGSVSAGGGGGGAVVPAVKAPTASTATGSATTGSTMFKGTVVKLSAPTGAQIYYTLDGSEPSESNGLVYTGAGIKVTEDATIKAITIKDGKSSDVVVLDYKVKTASATFKQDASSIKYMDSVSDTTFEPDRAATRYEVIAALGELLDIEDAKLEDAFKDVENEYTGLVNKFAATAIIDGYPDGTFGGKNGITRAELVKMLATALELDITDTSKSSFEDVNGHWAEAYIAEFSKLSYLLGYPDGTFRPDENVTRAEVVAIVNRIIKVNADSQAEQKYTDLDSNHWAYADIMTVEK